MIRIAAVGDVHFGSDSTGHLRPHLEELPAQADLLLLAGDLTRRGEAHEAEVLAEELRGVTVPTVAVLGNHDYHLDQHNAITKILEDADVTVLEGETAELSIAGCRVGIAGTKGFGGGFAGACATDFGEREMKAFVRHTHALAARLSDNLRALDCEVKIALLHYAPVEGTLRGERPEIYPFLGSYLLGEAIDGGGAHVALHGHAHAGVEKGVTPGGVHVRNVAQPVIRHAFNVYCVGGDADPG